MDNREIKNIIAKLAEKDDQKAFRIFFSHYYTRLIKFALLFVSCQHHAEEVVSEVMIKLLRKRKKLFALKNFEGYLFLAVKNQSISFLRKQKTQNNHRSFDFDKDQVIDHCDPEKKLQADELSQLIDHTINKLPPRRQMIFKMVKEERLRIKQVAHLLDLAPKTVENHLDMAMKDLRTTVKSYMEDQSTRTPIIRMIKIVATLIVFIPFL